MTTDRVLLPILLLLDCALTLIVFNVVGHYRGITGHFVFWPLRAPLAALVLAIYLVDGYRARTDLLSIDYAILHLIAVAAAMIGVLLVDYAFLPGSYDLQSSRSVIAFSFLLLIPLTLGHRRMLYLQMAASRAEQSFIFLGDRASCATFREEYGKMKMRQPVIYSTMAAAVDPAGDASDAVLRPFPELLAQVQSGRLSVEAIVLRESSRELGPDTALHLMRLYLSGVPTYTLELFYQQYWRKIPLYRLNPTWLFQEGFQIAREPVFERLKRLSDVLFSGVGLLFFLPFAAVAALAIWLEDRGPIFFIQTRIGRNHLPFRLAKLRSMRAGGSGGDPYTRPGDARVTRVGRFLRAARLDEVPQLWNVLRGDMSLIGPRAEWDRLVQEYERQIPCYYYRHLVKPGITGWAQVNYFYGANLEDTMRKLEYDLYYIRHFSFLLDASIALKTIQIMLFGRGR